MSNKHKLPKVLLALTAFLLMSVGALVIGGALTRTTTAPATSDRASQDGLSRAMTFSPPSTAP